METVSAFGAFVRVAETRSLVAAAQHLGVSASAVGKTITRLERQLGVRLFHRNTRSMTLTAEGELFLVRSRRILAEVEAAEAELSELSTEPRGRLRISLPLVSEPFLPTLLDFQAHHPHGAARPAPLSGPSFAQEVAAGVPTAITVASSDSEVANRLQEELTAPGLRIYTNDDVIGVELGGALKNVIAIASGIASGLGLGHNSVAAIITRGVAEITRLAVACGGQKETLAGLSGLGDLVLTCTGPLSRNRSVGIELGRGHKLATVLAELHGKVAEGVRTTSAALGLARAHGVEMPITEQMAAILEQGKSPQDAIRELMARPGREE